MKILFPLSVGGSGAWLYDANGKFVADCSHSHYACDLVRANAKAIADLSEKAATAAELLEALNRVLAWADPFALPNCDRNEADVKFARAAIAKAEGR